jgi:hypothetical protein
MEKEYGEINEKIKETKILLLAEVDNKSTESAHENADNALCDLLRALGFDEIVDIYEKVDKWYA